MKSKSTELSGGEGFTFEDLVTSYYLSALLREESAAGQLGDVVRVAVQQSSQEEPLDDLIIDTLHHSEPRRLSLQSKKKIVIGTTESNTDFKSILTESRKTRANSSFRVGVDKYGFATEQVAQERHRSLNRLIDWANASPTGADFEARFKPGGEASKKEVALRDEIQVFLGLTDIDDEADFYRHFVALKLDGLEEGEDRYATLVNNLEVLIHPKSGASGAALLSSLRHKVRLGQGRATVWARSTLLAEIKQQFQLLTAPSYANDVKKISEFATASLNEIQRDIGGIRIERPVLVELAQEQLKTRRLVNVSGLPGCGKSAVLAELVEAASDFGPVLFLKSDKLEGKSWTSFAAKLGLEHSDPAALLNEIGSSGAAVLFIDGIDRVRPDEQGIIRDLLNTLHNDPSLSDWRVLVTSRDQGLEAFRSWLPTRFYQATGIGDVEVKAFNNDESETLANAKPELSALLFGAESVQEIARRPFFASVLVDQIAADTFDADAPPQTETELILVWWNAGGYAADENEALPRQRAILDLAEKGVAALGKSIPVRKLEASTTRQIAGLKKDRVVDEVTTGSLFKFAHDIFFEWAFFRLLIDLGEEWPSALIEAGEPPLLGRIVSLYSQHTLEGDNGWVAGYDKLAELPLRSQWKRAWLTAPPSSPCFFEHLPAFEQLISRDDYALLEKFLVWLQAESTIPNPGVLSNRDHGLAGEELIRAADLTGWPSDFSTWRRALVWVLSKQESFPPHIIASVLELAGVWQNVFAQVENTISKSIVTNAAKWLEELERPRVRGAKVSEDDRWGALSSDKRATITRNARYMILRSARAYPDTAIALIDSVINTEYRGDLFGEIMDFAPTLAAVCPDKLAELVHAEVTEELPKPKLEREEREQEKHFELLRNIREKPEAERSEREKRILSNAASSAFSRLGRNDLKLDDLSVDSHYSYYYPPTPLHQPFAALFENAPDIARSLVRDLTNHAIRAWRQIHELDSRQFGTPLPLDIDFPWGGHRFWGTEREYSWFRGVVAPQPVEAALLALTYWAHKSLDDGQPVDDIIRDVVEGHECWTVLGIAASLILESRHVSQVTLPIAACQRLWHVDMRRQVQESSHGINVLGIDPKDKMRPQQRAAIEYLDSRQFRGRSVKDTACIFALSSDDNIRESFKQRLASFPENLPFSYEEERSSEGASEYYLELAENWSPLGNSRHYSLENYASEPGYKLVSYHAPNTPSPKKQTAIEENHKSLTEFALINWGIETLKTKTVQPEATMETAIEFVKQRDQRTLFDQLAESGTNTSTTQSALAVVAAVASKHAATESDRDWAWTILDRVFSMKDEDALDRYGDKPFHPQAFYITALSWSLRSNEPRADATEKLIILATNPNKQVATTALTALLLLSDFFPRTSWIATAMATELCAIPHASYDEAGERDHTSRHQAIESVQKRALERLHSNEHFSLAPPPSAWVYATETSRPLFGEGEEYKTWRHPDVSFDHQWAETLFDELPVEKLCGQAAYKGDFLNYLEQLVGWLENYLFPTWRTEEQDRRRYSSSDLGMWPYKLAQLVARALPYIETDNAICSYIAPISSKPIERDDAALSYISPLIRTVMCRYVYDAQELKDGIIRILEFCLDRVLQEPVFEITSYRSGEITNYHLRDAVTDFFLVTVEEAPKSVRFANGDWSDLHRMLPLIDKFISKAGWAPQVMNDYIKMCTRAGTELGVSDFSKHISTSLDDVEPYYEKWSGLWIPAYISGVVQRLAAANHPQPYDDARKLLIILDRLIDKGDRRASALEQSEYFRNIQTGAGI